MITALRRTVKSPKWDMDSSILRALPSKSAALMNINVRQQDDALLAEQHET